MTRAIRLLLMIAVAGGIWVSPRSLPAAEEMGEETVAEETAAAVETPVQAAAEAVSPEAQQATEQAATAAEETKAGVGEKKAAVAAPKPRISDVTLEDGQVSVHGKSLPKPRVSTMADGRIILKFPKTGLPKTAPSVKGNDVIQAVRWGPQADGSAHVVLQAVVGTTGEAAASADGYVFTYAAAQAAPAEQPAAAAPAPEAAAPEAAAPEPVSEEPARSVARLIGQVLKPSANGCKVVLTADSPVRYKIHKLTSPDRVLVRFVDTKMDMSEKKRVLKSEAGKSSGLLQVEARQLPLKSPMMAEVMLTLLPGATFQVDRDANQVVVAISAAPAVEREISKSGSLNQTVSVDLEGADLKSVLKALGTEAGYDVDVADQVTGSVNQRLKNVPLKTALAVLLAPGNYRYEIQGNLLRIGTGAQLAASKDLLPHITQILQTGGMSPSQLDALVRSVLPTTNAIKTTADTTRNVLVLNGTRGDVDEFRATMRDLKLDSSESDRITRVVKLNYADPESISTLLTPYLTPIGKAQVDVRSKSLVLWEAAGNMGVLLEVIRELDVPLQQVLIESTIVEVNLNTISEMGVVWNAGRGGDPTLSAGVTQYVRQLSNAGEVKFGTVKSGFNVNATISALQENQNGKVISRPKIATLNGVAARIQTTENVIYETVTQLIPVSGLGTITYSSTTLPLPILLSVLPRITDDGKITTAVEVEITSVSGPAVGTAQPPTTTQRAITTLTVKNGETIVIGGLVRDVLQENVKRIPLLGSLPVFGALFRNTYKQNRKVELIIFITPTLMET